MSFSKHHKKLPSSFKIQITSMVDMFVILLVFLIKSYSTSPVQIPPSNDLRLPASISTMDPVDVLKLVVSKKGIFVEGNRVVEFGENYSFAKGDLDSQDSSFIQPLFKALDDEAKKTQEIAKVNTAMKFEGKILIQADKDMNYELVQKVLHTSSIAGYADVKFAVLSND